MEISLVVFVPNIATNHAITYTNNVNSTGYRRQNGRQPRRFYTFCSRYCQTFALKTWQEQQKYGLTRDKSRI